MICKDAKLVSSSLWATVTVFIIIIIVCNTYNEQLAYVSFIDQHAVSQNTTQYISAPPVYSFTGIDLCFDGQGCVWKYTNEEGQIQPGELPGLSAACMYLCVHVCTREVLVVRECQRVNHEVSAGMICSSSFIFPNTTLTIKDEFDLKLCEQ